MSRNTGESLAFVGVGCLGIILFMVAGALFSGLVLLIGWNLVMPSLFGLMPISYPQAVGLMLVLWIIGGAIRTMLTVNTK